MSEHKPTDLAIGFSYTITLGEKRQLVFQSAIPADAPASDLIKLISKLRQAADVENKWAEINRLEEDIDLAAIQVGNAAANIAHLDAKGGERVMSEGGSYRAVKRTQAEELKDKADRENALTTWKRAKEIVEEKREKIETLKEEINALASATDRDAREPNREDAGLH